MFPEQTNKLTTFEMRESRRQRRAFHLLIPGSIIIIYDVDLFHLDIFIFILFNAVLVWIILDRVTLDWYIVMSSVCHLRSASFFGHVDALPVLDQVEMIPRNFSASFE